MRLCLKNKRGKFDPWSPGTKLQCAINEHLSMTPYTKYYEIWPSVTWQASCQIIKTLVTINVFSVKNREFYSLFFGPKMTESLDLWKRFCFSYIWRLKYWFYRAYAKSLNTFTKVSFYSCWQYKEQLLLTLP